MAEKVRVIHLEDKLKALGSELKKQKELNQRLVHSLHKKEGVLEKTGFLGAVPEPPALNQKDEA